MACGPGGNAPVLDPLGDVVAPVGQELRLDLVASDDDHGDLSFSVSNDDLEDVHQRTSLQDYGGGRAAFLFSPNVHDVGVHAFDFTVTDGDGRWDRETVFIEVRSAAGVDGAPVFRAPVASGTHLDVQASLCLELDVLVEDPDTAMVALTQEAPLIAGADLAQQSGFSARWRWCPSASQVSAQSRYALILGADDGEHAIVSKSFLIILEGAPSGGGCGAVTWAGSCEGNTLVYCNAGAVARVDCGASRCAFDTSSMVYDCLSGTEGGGDDSCTWAGDGVCDEPTYCSQGTDTTDCG